MERCRSYARTCAALPRSRIMFAASANEETDRVRFDRPVGLVAIIHKNGGTACFLAGRDVAPAVTDHKARRQINRALGCGLENQARLRLAARATVGIGVKAGLDVVNGKLGTNDVVHGLDDGAWRAAGSHVGLVGDDDHQEACGF